MLPGPPAVMLTPSGRAGGDAHEHQREPVRRDRGRRTLRRVADRDAAGPQGLQGPGRRPGDLPERHALDPHRPPAGRGVAAAVGPARPAHGDRVPADRHLRVRLRPLHDLRGARHRRRPRSPTPRGGPCWTSCWSTPRPRRGRRSGRGSPSRRSSSRTGASPASAATAGSGGTVTERARVVVGADGRHSLVARAVRPEQYHEKPQLLAGYYTYWSGLPMDGRFETWVRPDRGFAAWPTNDDLTLVIGGWPFAEFEANKNDIEGNFLKMLELAPEFADRVRAATREARFVGTAVPNYFRKPYGPGWALVGDAGYNKDFITAQGIHDALPRRRALCHGAGRGVLRRQRLRRPRWAATRPRATSRSCRCTSSPAELATLEPPPPELQQLLAAVHGNQEAMDGFARVMRGRDLARRVLLRGERRTDPRRDTLSSAVPRHHETPGDSRVRALPSPYRARAVVSPGVSCRGARSHAFWGASTGAEAGLWMTLGTSGAEVLTRVGMAVDNPVDGWGRPPERENSLLPATCSEAREGPVDRKKLRTGCRDPVRYSGR